MAKRSYGQYCGLAHALDLIGERWSLLVIRELMTGPKRYKDLATLIGSTHGSDQGGQGAGSEEEPQAAHRRKEGISQQAFAQERFVFRRRHDAKWIEVVWITASHRRVSET